MPLTNKQIPKRYELLGINMPAATSAGETVVNVMPNPTKGVPPHKAKFSSQVQASNKGLVPNIAHESQHSIYGRIKQQYGEDTYNNVLKHTMAVLNPMERKVLKHVNLFHTDDPEEDVAYMHNYLMDKRYRDRVHLTHNLSPKASRNLQGMAKHVWKKLQNHAATLDFPTIQKREVPVFPKIGIPDRRKQVELINEPHKLLTKLRTMGHAGAKAHYEQGVWQENPKTGLVGKTPADPRTKSFHQSAAAHQARDEHARATLGQTTQMGAVSHGAPLGYALSGVLRPAMWASPHENESHGTLQHEEFHAQMNRVEQKFGKIARNALASNLWHALPKEQQALIDYLQHHHAGDYYEQRNPTHATEEKLARLFNHLNSPDTRQKFHEAQFLKVHEKPNGDVAPAGLYVIPGASQTYNKSMFDDAMKDAHRNLLAAAETANENWLRHGHTTSENIANPPVMAKNEASAHSDTIDHMHGYSHSLDMVLSAAQFLSGKPTDDTLFRNALRQHDGDVHVAALLAHGLHPTKENIKALYSVTKIQSLHKSLTSTEYAIVPAHPEAEGVVNELTEAIKLGHIQHVKLGGKHSKGSLLVRSDEENWLIKPGDNKNSPAAGVSQESATQSEREVAFYKCAEAVGIGHIVPQAELIMLNGKQAAAIHMLPFSWKNMDALKAEEPNIGRTSLEPYRQSGELFKWAILDYVLGNPDRHGMNLMVSDKDDGHKVALIDHGSAFAGPGFNPGLDSDSWVPYYLRVWSHGKWKDLTFEERIKALPRAPADMEQSLFHWALGINPERLAAIMQRYGIHAGPSLERLQKIKACKENMDLYIGKLWVL